MVLDKITKKRVITGSVLSVIFALCIAMTVYDSKDGSFIMADDDPSVIAYNDAYPTEEEPKLLPGDIAWMLTSTALVLLMTPGLAFFYGGMVRAKNVISTLLQSFMAMGVITILWTVVGFSLAFGDSLSGYMGNPATFPFYNNVGAAADTNFSATIPLALYSLFQLKFAIITPALISGAIAERVRFTSYIIFIILFSLFIYCPLAHMTWHPDGLLAKAGILDFAGGTVVHMSSGYAALVGSIILGPRKDVKKMQPANIPFVMLGTALLWFGWFGFNAGSALAASPLAVQAFLTTNTATAAAMLTWVFVDHIRGSKSTAMGACVGAVVGLVVITPGAGFVTIGGSACMGMIGAVISNVVAHYFNTKANIDDTLDVWPCHGLGGTVGMVLTSCFCTSTVNPDSPDGLFYGDPTTFWHHLVALVCIIPFIMGMSFVCYQITNFIYPLRCGEKSEKLGLDMSQHKETIILEDEGMEKPVDDLDASSRIELGSM
jgi:Amt family ammonium transporter|eukprot:evm.model.NODE_25915_length_48178_cov_38.282433.5